MSRKSLGHALGLATRATIMLVESLRRFASGLQRRSVEEVSVAGMRSHLPGPHPDENLYTTSNMPLGGALAAAGTFHVAPAGDVLHPWASLLSTPMHRVGSLRHARGFLSFGQASVDVVLCHAETAHVSTDAKHLHREGHATWVFLRYDHVLFHVPNQ